MKARGGPSVTKPQTDAFKAGGLDEYMDASVRSMGKRGDAGLSRDVRQVGRADARRKAGKTGSSSTTSAASRPTPCSGQLDPYLRLLRRRWKGAFRERAAVHPGPETIRHLDDRAVPTHRRHEFRMWEDVLNPKINPLSREDLLAVRQALGNIIPEGGIGKGIAIPGQGRAAAQPPLATRMVKEIQADDVARIRHSIKGRTEDSGVDAEEHTRRHRYPVHAALQRRRRRHPDPDPGQAVHARAPTSARTRRWPTSSAG